MTPAGQVTVIVTMTDLGSPSGIGTLVAAPDGHIYGITDKGFFKTSLAGAVTILTTFTDRGPVDLVLARDGNFYVTRLKSPPDERATLFRITPTGVATESTPSPERYTVRRT